jgi:minor histocompatibility antigen H13
MPSLLTISNVSIFLLWSLSQYILIPYVAHLLMLVTTILYTACHYSLILREEQALSRGEIDTSKTQEERDNAAPPPASETLTSEDAMQFPLVGSCSLFGLYCAFKFFDKDTVNIILSAYFALMGCGAVTATLSPVLAVLGGPLTSVKFAKDIKINHKLPSFIAGDSPWDLSFNITLADLLAFLSSALFSAFYVQKKHWVMNNVLGISFCLKGIERFSLGTYKIGAILLVGLFFYDIFWVFGTDVMVTVAKSLDGPIKILFPRSLVPDEETGKIELSLLGLGDIVIPGFFLALLLRFDAHNAKVSYFPTDVHASFPKPYFHSALFGYVLGMGATMFGEFDRCAWWCHFYDCVVIIVSYSYS